jgi:hypothetical protein
LLWQDPTTGALLVDEVKTGHRGVALLSTHAQLERYVLAVAATTDGRRVYARAVSTRAPETSWFLTATTDGADRHVMQRGPPTC